MEATSMRFKGFARNFLREGDTISLRRNSAEKQAMQTSSDLKDRILDEFIVFVLLLILRHAVDTHGNDGVTRVLQPQPHVAPHLRTPDSFELGHILIERRELLKGGVQAGLLLVVAPHIPVSVVNVLLPLVVPVAAAGAQVELLDPPVLDLLAEGEDAHLLHHVDMSRVVEVEHTKENLGIPVEVVLLLGRAVVVTQLQDGRLALAAQQTGQACVREAEQHIQIHVVPKPPHVEVDLVFLIPPPVEDLPIPHGPDDVDKLLLEANCGSVELQPRGAESWRRDSSTDNSSIILKPSLSSKCGFTIKKDHLGNAVIYASIQNCFAQNVVSVKKAAPTDYNLPAYPDSDPRKAAEQPMDAGFRITTVVFFTPEERVMQVDEAQRNGYGISSTPTRLVLRSPNPSRETYTKDVAGVPMTVLSTLIIFEKTKLTTQLYAGAACPQAQGGVYFTETSIRWFLPRRIDPLIYSKHFRLLEVNMGVDGRKLEATEVSARNYSLTVDDLYVIVEIPIGAAGCQIKKEMGVTIYTLHLTFGFLVLPKHAPFTATAYLRAKLEDIAPPSAAPPSVSGSCDDKNFYVLVKYGTKGFNFQTIMGKRVLTGSLAQQYGLMGNDTHFSLIVPFSAADATVEAVESSSIKSRLDVTLRYPKTNKNIQDFSLACNFVTKLIECFPNGTITAMAITLESVPSLNPRRLTLRNPACGPTYSNDQYAYFVFTANSCGTTRKFLPNMMLYENEISITDELELRKLAQSKEPEFDLKVFCYYDINTNQAMASTPDLAGVNRGTDGILQPKVSIELAYCWATLEEDKMSLPRWDLIVNGCANSRDPHPVIFHSVLPKGRVNDPSNVKRFAVPMFAFAEDKDNLNRQVKNLPFQMTLVSKA
ncbi:hypothetical protein F7725_019727 [Dissostichus mawsoni]|uniref:ZP domain-containing protein n=1 Tax=Dissostichus mawsoni TaxID=36200 RepID=A0A7J5YP09_DISMA|nr:hypothetical protein F7725_019727 [Dissostichus mawsoni]